MNDFTLTAQERVMYKSNYFRGRSLIRLRNHIVDAISLVMYCILFVGVLLVFTGTLHEIWHLLSPKVVAWGSSLWILSTAWLMGR